MCTNLILYLKQSSVACWYMSFVFLSYLSLQFLLRNHTQVLLHLCSSLVFFFFFKQTRTAKKKYYKSCNTNRSQRGKYFNRVKSYVLFLLLSLFIIYQHLQILHHMLLVCFSRLSSSWHLPSLHFLFCPHLSTPLTLISLSCFLLSSTLKPLLAFSGASYSRHSWNSCWIGEWRQTNVLLGC